MTTTIIPKSGPDYVPGHYSTTVRDVYHWPALFNDKWLNKVFGDFDQAFDDPNAVYPYNILTIKDSKGEIKQYEIEVALAGVGKENIDVKVRDRQLLIDVFSNKDETVKDADGVTYLKKGISQRKGSLTFRLHDKVNSKKITSSYQDGLLSVTVPVVQPETIDIDIKVN